MFEWVKQNYKNQSSRRAFTLLESIVAIYVLLLGIVGAMTLAERNITSVLTLKDQLVAANLAQEGLELVRNKRDSNFLRRANTGCSLFFPPCNANDANMDGMTTQVMCLEVGVACEGIPCSGGNCGIVDPIVGNDHITFDTCSNLNNCDIYIGGDGVYDHDSFASTQTKFRRTISMTQFEWRLNMNDIGGTDNDINDWGVTVNVSWQDRFGTKFVELKTVLTPIFQVGS